MSDTQGVGDHLELKAVSFAYGGGESAQVGDEGEGEEAQGKSKVQNPKLKVCTERS